MQNQIVDLKNKNKVILISSIFGTFGIFLTLIPAIICLCRYRSLYNKVHNSTSPGQNAAQNLQQEQAPIQAIQTGNNYHVENAGQNQNEPQQQVQVEGQYEQAQAQNANPVPNPTENYL